MGIIYKNKNMEYTVMIISYVPFENNTYIVVYKTKLFSSLGVLK
jgi:hypothetical protein